MAVVEPVTLEEAKAQCRVEFDTDDALISAYITAARQWAEGFLGFSLTREAEAETPAEPDTSTDTGENADTGTASDTDIKENTQADTDSTDNSANETQSDNTAAIEPEPEPEPIEIKQSYKQAILLVVAFWYANRENATGTELKQIPLGAKDLLWLDRNVPV